jgi:AcrR family transcriptional regulator
VGRYQAGIRTEARIIEATRELLSEEGLEGATLKAICGRAGVQAGSFYNLFASKEEAVFRVVAEAITAVDPHPEGEGPDTVAELVAAYSAFVVDQRVVARIYLQIAVSGGLTDSDLTKRFLRHHERRLARFADAVGRENPTLPADEVRTEAELLLATLNGLAFHWMLQPSFDFAGHAARLVDARGTDRHG